MNSTWKWRMLLAVLCLGPSLGLLPVGAMAKEAGNCTAGATLRLSAPISSQGTLLLVEVKSAKPLAELKGDWGGRSVPFWQEAGRERVQRGLVGVDLEKAAGTYELKVTGQTACGEERAVCDRKLARGKRVR